MKHPNSEVSPSTPEDRGDNPSRHATIAIQAILGAAWILSGGCGLLGRPLASGMVWCCLTVAAAALLPKVRSSLRCWGVCMSALILAILAMSSGSEVVRLAGLALFAAALSALDRRSLDQRLLRVAAQAVAVFVLYRFALTAIPVVWQLSDWLAGVVGGLASKLWGGPLSLGATFAGLDHLVLMTLLIAGWSLQLEHPRLRPILLAVSAVVVGQALYLLCFSRAVDLASLLPSAPATASPDPYVPPDWSWSDAARTLLPWNLPALAVLWHLAVVGLLLRGVTYRSEAPAVAGTRCASRLRWKPWTAVGLAALLPIVCVLSLGKNDLESKTILAFDQGYLDWEVPVHDRYGADSSGRFGMLASFVESLGGRLQHTSDLTAEQLSAADVLLLIHPNQAWSEELRDRVLQYVEQGGALLVAAGPRRQDSGGASSHNTLLEPMGMPVRFDTAVSQNEAWRHGLHAVSHPTGLGLGDDRDRFGMAAATSIQLPWYASPILVGRWGWSDPGSDFFLTGNARWDAGERMGDLVLAAERRLGKGRVIVLGDTACLSNQGNVRAYRFTGRLLAYLAHRATSPYAWWRQAIGLLLVGGLVVLWFRSARAELLPASLIALLLAFLLAETLSCRSWEVLPDGRTATPNRLAYLDSSHLEANAESPWVPDGVDGLTLTLMRNGLMVLAADDLSAERLRRAGMLVSVAPARRFTSAEQKRVKRFVDEGGTLIAMAGATHGRKINNLLKPFSVSVPSSYLPPGSKDEDALPYGCLYRPYPDGTRSVSAVVFHAAWPLIPLDKRATSVVSAENAQQGLWKPIIAKSNSSRGVVIAIGDTCFGMNKTLENQDGQSLTGDRANAHFWRWLIGQLPGHEPWQPPPFDWVGGDSDLPAVKPNADGEVQP